MGAPSVCVVNLGCRVNRVESDSIAEELAAAGLELAPEDEACVVVINTCAVTGEAEAKTRKAVRRALARPLEPWVVVCGCAVNLHPGAFAAFSPRVVEEPAKARVPLRVRALLDAEMAGTDRLPASDLPETGRMSAIDLPRTDHSFSQDVAETDAVCPTIDPVALLGRARLGVKIQDGCNNRCSYCIVWKARGPERSEAAEDVLAQVRAAAAAGVPEVVLTGVNLAAWRGEGADGPLGLDALLSRILDETGIAQVRLSSLEPMDVTPELIEVMGRSAGRVAPFMHLPLQSGCTATLRRMRRPYTAERYAEVVDRIRTGVPGIALACDVIAGFPGETESEFEESLAFCEAMGFSRMHVFRYSARPGTPAAEAPDQVPAEVKEARSRRLRELGERMAREDAASRIGTHERAVLEEGPRGTLGSFHRVVVDGLEPSDAARADDSPVCASDANDSPVPAGTPRLVEVAIMSMDEDGLLHGRLVPSA